jgi:lipopolysaccharide/colanic/teichoic acid biosynthesis glycosyltransferase
MPKKKEHKEAFPYRSPSAMLRRTYPEVFKLQAPLEPRLSKLVFDKVLAVTILLLVSPLVLLLWAAYIVEGVFIPSHGGPMLYSYKAVSGGRVFPKWKFRVIREDAILQDLAKVGDWHAYKNEWDPRCLTHVGRIVKAFYLDEIPQFFNVLRGDMSIVGPRPLAVHHYERDLKQGNVTRKVIRGGLLGLGHIMKGTAQMGDPVYEYEYIRQYMQRSGWGILRLDLGIIGRGILVILNGKGH